MIKTWNKAFGIIVILFAVICFIGCSDDDCEDYDVPWGYFEISRYSDGDYESVTYESGNGDHWLTFTSTDNGCTWEESNFWY